MQPYVHMYLHFDAEIGKHFKISYTQTNKTITKRPDTWNYTYCLAFKILLWLFHCLPILFKYIQISVTQTKFFVQKAYLSMYASG
jgi:hypothetical protein